MNQGKGKINKEELRAMSEEQISMGRMMASLIAHNGWKVFMALYADKKREIAEKDDYASLEDFNADRRALKIVKEMIAEIESYVEDADSAMELLNKFNKADNQTPESILSIDGEEETVGEG